LSSALSSQRVKNQPLTRKCSGKFKRKFPGAPLLRRKTIYNKLKGFQK